jgi:hypothetical protein
MRRPERARLMTAPQRPTCRAKTYAQRNGLRSAVVSMSLGGPRSAALNDAVAELTAAGLTVVVAAGERIIVGLQLEPGPPGSA